MPEHLRPTRAIIDLNALEHNLREVRKKAAVRAVLAVVKADAYGHGAVEVARRLEAAGAEMLGVALAEEGAELRAAGIRLPILVLGGVFGEQAEYVLDNCLIPTVYSMSHAEAFARAACKRCMSIPVHVKVDTGMGRVGMAPDEAVEFISGLCGMPGIWVQGVMTHLADASGPDKSFAGYQIGEFTRVVHALAAAGIKVPLLHAAGSAAIIEYDPAHFNMVRPGIMMYGCYPSERMEPLLELRPVMSLVTRVMHIKRMGPGRPVSYNRTFHTRRDSVIATLPIGYADGLSRGLSNRGHVLINGRRCPIVGTVCMDLTMVDVTDAPDVEIGDEAVLIGRQGAEEITADEVAGLLNTISYEVLCGVGRRVRREYV